MKFLLGFIVGIIVLVGGFYFLAKYFNQEEIMTDTEDFRDVEYVIEGERVKLVNGVAETQAAPNSATKTITRYFGNDLLVDLNQDGKDDVVFLLTQERGGSGVFYFVAAALASEEGYRGSETYYLGDRIAPQTLERGEGTILVVNYMDRAQGEDFSVRPSVGKSEWLLLDTNTMQFGTVEQDFSGEADPTRMTLTMKPWEWVSAAYENDEITPKKPNTFVLTFDTNDTFSARTDCNSLNGKYEASDGTISFGAIASTKMFCADSQESDFTTFLQLAETYNFTSKGELIIEFVGDAGLAVFR